MKNLIIGALGALLVVGILGGVMVASVAAQTPNPPANPSYPYGGGFMGGGMMGGNFQDGDDGFMHDEIIATLAEKTGLTTEEINARLDEGQTMFEIAEAEGLTAEDLGSIMLEAREKALEEAVADGSLTQEQADWMNERMQNRPFYGQNEGMPCFDEDYTPQSGFMPRGRGARWANQTSTD